MNSEPVFPVVSTGAERCEQAAAAYAVYPNELAVDGYFH